MISIIPNAPLLRCHMLDTGYCLAWEHHALTGARHIRIQCHSLVALLQHPQHGWLLWDTGYHPRMLDATATFPYSLYRRVTPLFIRPELAVARQLDAFGLKPSDIRLVFVSHFHADHIAGLRDFPDATYVTLRAAYQHVAPLSGFSALRRGFLPMLLLPDFARRATFPDTFAGPLLPGLGPTCDYFGDGSLLLVLLPGHARGQIGMLAQTENGPVLFAADCCWLSRSIREVRPPARIASFIADSPAAVLDTITRAHTFAQAHPNVRIVPSHCPEAFAREVITPRPLRI
jgi:glyoxylase-like metal-dependent hydrolase (beta-lactamase superfamily II)